MLCPAAARAPGPGKNWPVPTKPEHTSVPLCTQNKGCVLVVAAGRGQADCAAVAAEKRQVRTLMLKTRTGLEAQAGTIHGKEGAEVSLEEGIKSG